MDNADPKRPVIPYRTPPGVRRGAGYFPHRKSPAYQIIWWIAFTIVIGFTLLVLAAIVWLKSEELRGR